MDTASQSGQSYRSLDFTGHSSHQQSPKTSHGDGSKRDLPGLEPEPDQNTVTSSMSEQSTVSIQSQSSTEDLNRIHRWIALQERMANLNTLPKQGHTYGTLTVVGNARAIRGNVYTSSTSSCQRSHTYGETEADGNSMVQLGDVCIAASEKVRG